MSYPLEPCPLSAKFSYPTRKAAERAANEQKRRKRSTRPIQAYQCERCGNWHLAGFWPDRQPR